MSWETFNKEVSQYEENKNDTLLLSIAKSKIDKIILTNAGPNMQIAILPPVFPNELETKKYKAW